MAALATSAFAVMGWNPVTGLLAKRNDINGKGLTCTGVLMTPAIHANIRGENPEVPVGLISRFPMLDDTERGLSYFHVYSAFVLMVVLYVNFAGPKGTHINKAKAKFHMMTGRILSWLIAPHYAIIGLILNYFAVMRPKMEDWLLGTDVTGWRAQMAYITPFGLNVLVVTFMGFYLNRYPFMKAKPWATILKYISALSILYWATIGSYMQGAQILGYSGSFGLPIEKTLDGGGKFTTENQDWFRTVAFLTFQVGWLQAGFDFVNYKILTLVEESGNSVISWKDMHKWCMLNLAFQSGFIFGFFVAIFPYCSFGFPDWTCLPLLFAAPIAMACIWPFFVHVFWMYSFVKALFGYGTTIKEFSKSSHEWDRQMTWGKFLL